MLIKQLLGTNQAIHLSENCVLVSETSSVAAADVQWHAILLWTSIIKDQQVILWDPGGAEFLLNRTKYQDYSGERKAVLPALFSMRRKSRFDGISADCYESGLGTSRNFRMGGCHVPCWVGQWTRRHVGCAICWTRCGPKKQAMDVLQKEEELATDGRRRTDHKPGGKLMLLASFG